MHKPFHLIATGAFCVLSLAIGCSGDDAGGTEQLAMAALGLAASQPDAVDNGSGGATGATCTVGSGGRVNVGNSNSFFTKLTDLGGNTTSCSFKATFNDGSEKTIFLTADGTGQTTTQKDSCGNETSVSTTQQDEFTAAEMLDQFYENISGTPSAASNSFIIPGTGEPPESVAHGSINPNTGVAYNDETDTSHIANTRSTGYGCGYPPP
ncbi:MAG: hypothetical protein KDK33_04965 [Leptospiraceae bacterium]|nr:hypothetical protein [Leptospiraceae bacterium]